MLYPDNRFTLSGLQAAAALYQFPAGAPANARVLDLGCGYGDALLSAALAWPGCVGIGIDINEDAIAEGQRQAQRLGITHIELVAAGVNDVLNVSPGEFDYILIRGSFMPESMLERDALLQWCRRHLSAQGIIAFHQVFTFPESAAQYVQDALAFHARLAERPEDKVAFARGMLSYLALTQPEGEIKQYVLEMERADDAALIEALARATHTFAQFHHFTESLLSCGLRYVGDALPQYESGESVSEHIHQLHALVSSGQTSTAAQQYLDFAVNRRERVGLLSRDDAVNAAALDFTRLNKLHWAGDFRRCRNDRGEVVNAHTNAEGKFFSTQNTTTLHILDLLGGAWPLSLSFDQLVSNARLPEKEEDVAQSVLESLKDLFLNQIPGLHWAGSPGPYNVQPEGELTLIAPLQVGQDADITFNLWGERVALSEDEREFAVAGMDVNQARSRERFTALKAKGLLKGSPEAWRKALQHFLRLGDVDYLKSNIDTLLLLNVGSQQGGLLVDGQIMAGERDEQDPDIDLIYQKVNALIAAGLAKDARDYITGQIDNDPHNLHMLRCFSRASLLMGDWDEALLALCQLMSRYSAGQDIWFDLATVLQKKGELHYAARILQTLLRLNKQNASFWNTLAVVYHARRNMAMAERCARESLRYNATNPLHLAMMGIILSDNQKLTEARYFLEKSLEFAPGDFDCFTSLLFVLTHDFSVSPEVLFERHLAYGELVTAWAKNVDLTLPWQGSKDPERPLRVGFVSGDFSNHPVSRFLRPFWDGMDRERFSLYGYSTLDKDDAVTEHFRNTSTKWLSVTHLNNVELAKQIHSDGIDILFDLSGHTTGTRLPAFALKPAPVQITWLGYPGTTGMRQIDYRIISTGFVRSAEIDAQFTEKLIAIPLDNFFEPDASSPDVNTLPALKNGWFTYGSFNRPKKLNDRVFALWARILLHNTASRLLIGFMDDDAMIARYRKKLNALGVSDEQLIFRKTTGLEAYLHMHHEVDMLLDSFPYNGGTTTSHGIWMGVPTLTLAGATYPARQGLEIMHIYGLDEFVAESQQDYFDKAVSWQTRLETLSALRQNMRSTIPPQGQSNVAIPFQQALREAWRKWCADEAPRSFQVSGTED
ncbi:TPA: methyltransferase domain-containing protein [Enterobacter bugandensis]|uniref:O-linked N-acetylglucosamine transferase family protein n=1 Tax=Enterobacter bugandensis TaxID=881260 RepID=UPI00200559AE|nr:methyltransferase domain-containing protein [Enterobacter bugandensis]MCK7447548.1 methyltransferase domain-containing protein [Enterobacter bugandensis]HCM9242758.1 methyltransferase domain-containing protein [Enterobacter bugandensis]